MNAEFLAHGVVPEITDFAERQKLLQEYQRAAAAVGVFSTEARKFRHRERYAREQAEIWEQREREARADLERAVAGFEINGWMLP